MHVRRRMDHNKGGIISNNVKQRNPTVFGCKFDRSTKLAHIGLWSARFKDRFTFVLPWPAHIIGGIVRDVPFQRPLGQCAG